MHRHVKIFSRYIDVPCHDVDVTYSVNRLWYYSIGMILLEDVRRTRPLSCCVTTGTSLATVIQTGVTPTQRTTPTTVPPPARPPSDGWRSGVSSARWGWQSGRAVAEAVVARGLREANGAQIPLQWAEDAGRLQGVSQPGSTHGKDTSEGPPSARLAQTRGLTPQVGRYHLFFLKGSH